MKFQFTPTGIKESGDYLESLGVISKTERVALEGQCLVHEANRVWEKQNIQRGETGTVTDKELGIDIPHEEN